MIDVAGEGSVALITINRPRRRNALDTDGLRSLRAALAGAVADARRVVVLAGAHGVFCSGADLSTVEDPAFVAELEGLLEELRTCPCPTIAALEGFALGAGAQLAVACDLRTATQDVLIGIRAAHLGIVVPEWSVRRLVSLVGQGHARAMFLGDEQPDGARALEIGFAQRAGDLSEARAWAADIAQLAPLTLTAHKVGLNEVEQLAGASTAYAEASDKAWRSDDLQEGFDAFRQKRRPTFTGR